MGQSNIQNKGHRGDNISTVGVDIGDLTLKRFGREVIFSTWDFGGQVRFYSVYIMLIIMSIY